MKARVGTFLRVLIFMIACAVIVMIAAPLATRFSAKQSEILIGAIASVATLALTFAFTRWERLRLADVGAIPTRRSLYRLAIGFLIGVAIIATWAFLCFVFASMRWARNEHPAFPSIAIAAVAYVALACREELAFHAYPLRKMQRLTGLWPAQIFIAIVFALEHKLGGATWSGSFLGPAVGSLLFGMAAIATDGLAIPIGIHAAWNIGHWALGFKSDPGVWRAVAGGNSWAPTAMYDVVMIIATVGFWLWYRRSHSPNGDSLVGSPFSCL